MAIRWSSIHEQLGVTPCDLDYAMIQEAVSQHLLEAEGLDWKKSDPANADQALDEVAKDIAAMANTRGGLLVYGVEEEPGSGRAQRINGANVAEGVQRRIRAGAASRIRPLVAGLDFAALTGPDGDILVLSRSTELRRAPLHRPAEPASSPVPVRARHAVDAGTRHREGLPRPVHRPGRRP